MKSRSETFESIIYIYILYEYTDTYTYTQTDVFLDTNATTPSIGGAVSILETVGSVSTKYLSGIEYYILGSQFTATVTDNQITRYRPKIIRPEGSTNAAQARQRISWQANRDLGSSLRMRATMTGFYNPDGDLWQKNKLITVDDKRLGINNTLLIESVTFKQAASENQGSVTELTLVHPSSYAIEPAAEEAPTKRVASKKAAETSTYFDL